MSVRFAFIILIFSVSTGCSKNKVEQLDDTLIVTKNDSVIVDSILNKLVQTILNLPGIVKYSKAEFIQKKYDKVFVRFDQQGATFSDSVIFQNGYSLKVIKDTVSSDKPCYVFKEIDIHGNHAYVQLHFNITGFICRGTLYYVEGKWVPDKTFQIGYR